MKKTCLLIIVLCLAFGLAGCKHKHKYNSEQVIEPTCTEKGYTEHTCKCGESYKDSEVAAKGHSFGEWVVVKEATEEEAGQKERTCSVCNEKETETLPKLEHVHKYESTVVEPTCTEKGYTVHTCPCGDTYNDSEVAAKGHSFGEWAVVKEATEEAEGLKERTCSVCNEKETETLPKLEHVHKYESTVVEPTCTEKGYTVHTCPCGDTYNDSEVAAKGHSFGEWVVVKEATEEAEGLKERTCACGEKESEVLPKLEHVHKYESKVVEPTCTKAGYTVHTCKCGDTYKDSEVAAKGHSFGEWVVVKEATEEAEGLKERTCACGEKETETLPKLEHVHKYGEWVVLKEATEEAEGLKERTCVCGEKETQVIAKLEHVHKYGEWVVAKEATKTAEGYKEKACACGEKETLVIPVLSDAFPGAVVYVGEGFDYTQLDEAIAYVADGSTIVLLSGEYSLTSVIDKSLRIYGSNAGLKTSDNKKPESLINVAKDVSGNLAAKNIEFNGVHLKGTGGGPGIPGISFQDGGNIEKLVFKSCEISDTNTFLKFVGGTSNLELVMEDCHIHTIGQFIVWTTTAINHTLLVGNYVDGSTCGGVTNENAALFRIRYGYLEAYNNVFNGDSANVPGYFECSKDASFVKYNVFKNVTLFAFPTASNKITFDKNLYLDKNGNPLSKVPSSNNANGVTVDTTIATSEAQVKVWYQNYLLEAYPDTYFTVEYDAAEGEITSDYVEVYNKNEGIAVLPTVAREGYIFVGWTLNGEVVDTIPVGTTGNLVITASWRELALIVDGTTEEGHYPTLSAALAAAKDGDIIRLVAGEYDENVTISVANLVIKGPNYGVNANTGSRIGEAVVKGVWTVTSTGHHLTVDGLSFTGAAKIKYDESVEYVGFTFANNKVYDTTESTVAWNINRYELPGFIQFTLKSGGKVSNTIIKNNSFVNVSEVNLLLNRAYNVSVDGNVFKDFDLDAIRTDGGYVYGALSFTNNVFEQTTLGAGNNGIFLYSNAGPSDSDKTSILIKNNSFIRLGKNNGTVFTGAISAYRFQEHPVAFVIENNIFDHCYDYLYLRNNGANNSPWSCLVQDNQFLGLPTNQYYGSYNGTDTETSNPHIAVFKANYYEDNNGEVITDLSEYASYFKHMASYGTALSAKPGSVEVKPTEFWTISYELDGGETSGSFVYEYHSLTLSEIALPVLTKPNHQFNGWLLDGELVLAIPATAKGDLMLVASFTQLEGEIYEVEFVENKENVIWPSRPAESREEIINELYKDLYEWAKSNGETKSYDDYVAWVTTKINAYDNIKLRNKELGNYPAEDGSTEYFFNVPKYYQKWNEFFAVFNTAMLAVNSGQIFYSDDYAAMVRLSQFITWSSTGQKYFASYIGKMCSATKVPAEIPTTYRGGQVVVLPVLSMANGLEFLGWYDNAEFTGSPITQINSTDTGNKVFYAKWAAEVLVEKLEINQISELLLYQTHQLVWTISPSDATNKEIEFFSSNESVVTVSAKGLITAIANGTATITVKVYGNRSLDLTFDVRVFVNDHIDASYETESYVGIDGSLQLNAEVIYKDGTTGKVNWTSATPDIATVDANGKVTALNAGQAKIIATDPKNAKLKVEFVITVLEPEIAEELEFILENHESNVFTRYNLGIGAGVPVYTKDIIGSVSKLLMNKDLVIDESLVNKEVEAGTGDYFDAMTSVEFITVHYTGNMSTGADSEANAKYFVGDNSVSIHYTTGNDGVYHCLPNNMGAWHAGDSGAYNQVGAFEWIKTGVKVGANDSLYPTFTISDDFYYEINGQKTTVKMPTPWNYENRGTNHKLNADGTISSQSNFGQTGFTNRTPESFINDQGLPFTIIDGEYYMGTTWWCYTQVYEGRICSTGGNRNSIGIESCVDKGSDLWLTWQMTAQLVAKLLVETGLDITKVRGHHFFSGKDCPQPMLENDQEIWYEFLALVEAEYEKLTKYSGYEISFTSHNTAILDNNGRIIKQPDETTCVSYTVTITKDGVSKSITLSSMVKGLYVDR